MRTLATLFFLLIPSVCVVADDSKHTPLQGTWKVYALSKGTEAVTAFAGFATITVKDDQIEWSAIPKFAEKAGASKIVFDAKKPNEFEFKVNDQSYQVLIEKDKEGQLAKLAIGHPGKAAPKVIPENGKTAKDVYVVMSMRFEK